MPSNMNTLNVIQVQCRIPENQLLPAARQLATHYRRDTTRLVDNDEAIIMLMHLLEPLGFTKFVPLGEFGLAWAGSSPLQTFRQLREGLFLLAPFLTEGDTVVHWGDDGGWMFTISESGELVESRATVVPIGNERVTTKDESIIAPLPVYHDPVISDTDVLNAVNERTITVRNRLVDAITQAVTNQTPLPLTVYRGNNGHWVCELAAAVIGEQHPSPGWFRAVNCYTKPGEHESPKLWVAINFRVAHAGRKTVDTFTMDWALDPDPRPTWWPTVTAILRDLNTHIQSLDAPTPPGTADFTDHATTRVTPGSKSYYVNLVRGDVCLPVYVVTQPAT